MHRSVALAVMSLVAAATLTACASKGTSNADFCPVTTKVATAQQALTTLLNSGDVPLADDVKAALDTFRDLLNRMADAAPKEIANNMLLVVNGFTAFDLGLQKVDYDYNRLFTDPEAAAAAQLDMAAMDAPETQAAMEAVDSYALTKCNVVLHTSRQ